MSRAGDGRADAARARWRRRSPSVSPVGYRDRLKRLGPDIVQSSNSALLTQSARRVVSRFRDNKARHFLHIRPLTAYHPSHRVIPPTKVVDNANASATRIPKVTVDFVFHLDKESSTIQSINRFLSEQEEGCQSIVVDPPSSRLISSRGKTQPSTAFLAGGDHSQGGLERMTAVSSLKTKDRRRQRKRAGCPSQMGVSQRNGWRGDLEC
ncbi:hypothetical protein R3P38DRAFT_3127373 [Favolaschia claudopus]|uniref:Uncharacterized protein n=1 Tax=Favolaschia claudopus TaxID=2862362 RepID=A0AAV9ZA12_9AGAR